MRQVSTPTLVLLPMMLVPARLLTPLLTLVSAQAIVPAIVPAFVPVPVSVFVPLLVSVFVPARTESPMRPA